METDYDDSVCINFVYLKISNDISIPSIEEDITDHFYTIILKNYSKFPLRGDYAYVEHDNHMHLIFSTAPNNLKRKLNSIMNLFGVSPESILECKNSLQLIRNRINLLNYMASRGVVKTIGDKYVNLISNIETKNWEDCNTIPSDCRRKRKYVESNLTTSDKRNRYLALAEEINARNITHISQIHQKFSIDELMTIIAKNGNIYKDVIRQAITYNNRKRVEYERKTKYTILYREKIFNEECDCSPDQHREGKEWIVNLLKENNIDIKDFVKKVENIFDKKKDKINGIVLEGPTNTGKSLLCNLLIYPYTYGTASRRGDQTNFHLENLLHKSIAVMEEPRITGITVDDFKQLLGGESFQVDVKYQEKDWLIRTPTIITTNEDIGLRLSKLDREALLSRIYLFNFKRQIKSDTILGHIPLPSFRICQFCWYLILCEHLFMSVGSSTSE